MNEAYYNMYLLNIHRYRKNKIKKELLKDKIISIALEYNSDYYSHEIKENIDKQEEVRNEYDLWIKKRDEMMNRLSGRS